MASQRPPGLQPPQVGHQGLGCPWIEPLGILHRLLDRQQRRLGLEPLHTETRPQVLRQQARIGDELGNMILPHREQHVEAWITLHRPGDLPEEILPVSPPVGVMGEQLLELVEDEQGRAAGDRRFPCGRTRRQKTARARRQASSRPGR